LGRTAWLKFDTCVILRQQFRFDTSSEDGRKLYNMVQLLSANTQPSLEQCADLCDQLNQRAIDPATFQRMCGVEVPRAVVLRNSVRPFLNARLTRLQASLAGQRLIVWRCADSGSAGQPLSAEVLSAIEQLPTRKTGDMATVQMYFRGIKYKLNVSPHPSLGICNNNIAEGVQLHLDPREEPDDVTKPYWTLQYIPLAVIIRPEGMAAQRLHLRSWPRGCVPFARDVARFQLVLPTPTRLYRDGDCRGTVVQVRRRGFPLDVANAVTDCFAQGMSFRGAPYVLHMNIPPDGKLNRANLLVPVSRPSLYSQLHLLAPLWPPNDMAARSAVIRKVHAVLKPDPHLVAEMERFERLEKETREVFAGVR
jgi:hypothetical protein